jgi:hypothetical protein
MSDTTPTEEFILLGGQISSKIPIYQDLAQIASYGFTWWFLKNALDPKWKKKTAHEKVLDIIYTSGQIEFINASSELTKLSAIIGDSRRRVSMKGLKDELTARINNAP